MCIVSKKHQCIFIHIPKNAGGSLRLALTNNISGTKPEGLHQHVSARTVREINRPQYDSFFSFAIVRNPWDRAWSMYKFALGRKGRGHPDVGDSFDDFLITRKGTHGWAKSFANPTLPAQRRSQTDWITDSDNNIIVNFIVRFENLHQDLERVYRKVGIPPLTLASHHNTSQKIHYTDAYSHEGIDFIRNHFAKDIEMFGYEFGE
jgi:hypothetical protein